MCLLLSKAPPESGNPHAGSLTSVWLWRHQGAGSPHAVTGHTSDLVPDSRAARLWSVHPTRQSAPFSGLQETGMASELLSTHVGILCSLETLSL